MTVNRGTRPTQARQTRIEQKRQEFAGIPQLSDNDAKLLQSREPSDDEADAMAEQIALAMREIRERKGESFHGLH